MKYKQTKRFRFSAGALIFLSALVFGFSKLWTGTPPHPAEFVQGNYSLGEANAPVVIVEFSDFQCFYCKKFTRETLPRLRKQYIETGKVRFVFSDFPLDIHPQAMGASRAARCAGRQDRFWQYHDGLFESELKSFRPSLFQKLARENGLDMKRFNGCLKNDEVRKEITANFKRARSIGVQGTPAFLVLTPKGGKIMSGAYPFKIFAQVIDAELAGAAKAAAPGNKAAKGESSKGTR